VKVLALTHGPSVGPGVFGAEIAAAGHELEVWSVPERPEPPAGGHDAVFVFGGSMHPDQEERHPWLRGEHRFLAAELERGTPLFGVCLGAQLLAKAAGAAVHPAAESEIGWTPVELTAAAAADPVFGTLPGRFEALEWHHYTYAVPEGAAELARSAGSTQAFRLGNAVGIQFHAEVTEAQLQQWIEEKTDEDVVDREALRAATRERIGAWNTLGRGLCRRFLETAA
jgi:GMP synthase-like glutamine amidotransferase